jgi:protein SCO1/2
MPVRARLTLMLTATFALAAALTIVLATGRHHGASGAGFDGAIPPPNLPARDFTLRDQDGKVVHLSDYRGRVVMLTFMYSTCRDTCPLTADQMKGAMNNLGHDVPSLAISVDPANDTPLNAKRFLYQRQMTGRMRFLLGTRAQLKPIWDAYGIQPQGDGKRPAGVDPRSFDHSAKVAIIDARGRLRIGIPVGELTPEGLAHDIRRLRAGA